MVVGFMEGIVVAFVGASLAVVKVKGWIGRTVVFEEEVAVRCIEGLDCAEGRVKVGEVGSGGECGAPSSSDDALGAGEGDGAMKGSMSEVACVPLDRASASGVSATLSLLDGRAKGLLGLSFANCDGRLTNGDCLSGNNIGDEGFDGGWNPLVGDITGDIARTVCGDAVAGDSFLLNGDARGENDILTWSQYRYLGCKASGALHLAVSVCMWMLRWLGTQTNNRKWALRRYVIVKLCGH